MNQLTQLPEWQALAEHYEEIKFKHLRELFTEDSQRFTKFSLKAAGLLLDFSKNKITQETLDRLIALSLAQRLPEKMEALFTGKLVNESEQRPALHSWLRNPTTYSTPLVANQLEIQAALTKMTNIINEIRLQQRYGYTKKPIRDIVHIGIGGSYLGPAMAYQALAPYVNPAIRCHFVANIDPADIYKTLSVLNPESTLFVIASKTFTTLETLENARAAKEWLLRASGSEKLIENHFIAITAYPERARAYGITEANILPIWEWVGGRYSLWSAMSFPLAVGIGMEQFRQLLAGAHAMDEHFQTAPFHKNMPVILALLGIWYINFWNIGSYGIIPYHQQLSLFPSYLQQLEMESNGKRIQQNGAPVDYATAPVIWGDVGTNSQHAFHQLLFQGTHLIPVDFIVAAKSHYDAEQHKLLFANCLAQSQALMEGCDDASLPSYQRVPGDQPSNTILMEQLTPFTLGALIALYEHKVFVQSVIWNINCFDQWGVELGKKLAGNLTSYLQDTHEENCHNSSTAGLLAYFRNLSGKTSR